MKKMSSWTLSEDVLNVQDPHRGFIIGTGCHTGYVVAHWYFPVATPGTASKTRIPLAKKNIFPTDQNTKEKGFKTADWMI